MNKDEAKVNARGLVIDAGLVLDKDTLQILNLGFDAGYDQAKRETATDYERLVKAAGSRGWT